MFLSVNSVPRSLGVALLTATLAASVSAADTGLSVQEVSVQSPGGGRLVTSGEAVIKNTGRTERVLVDVAVVGATAVELHEMKHSGGTMQMNRVSSVVIPAGGEVRLASGGLHLMIFGLKGVKAGDAAVLTFTFRDGAKVVAQAAVR